MGYDWEQCHWTYLLVCATSLTLAAQFVTRSTAAVAVEISIVARDGFKESGYKRDPHRKYKTKDSKWSEEGLDKGISRAILIYIDTNNIVVIRMSLQYIPFSNIIQNFEELPGLLP